MGIGSEDFLLHPRNEPHHPPPDALAENDEEDESLASKLRTQRDCFPGSISIQLLLFIGMIQDEESAGSFLCGFAFAFGWLTNSSAFRCNASVSLLFESITNLFDP